MDNSTDKCRECNGRMIPGKAMLPVYGKTMGDFLGDDTSKVVVGDTISPVSAALGDVLKCEKCGHSIGAHLLVSEGEISELP